MEYWPPLIEKNPLWPGGACSIPNQTVLANWVVNQQPCGCLPQCMGQNYASHTVQSLKSEPLSVLYQPPRKTTTYGTTSHSSATPHPSPPTTPHPSPPTTLHPSPAHHTTPIPCPAQSWHGLQLPLAECTVDVHTHLEVRPCKLLKSKAVHICRKCEVSPLQRDQLGPDVHEGKQGVGRVPS